MGKDLNLNPIHRIMLEKPLYGFRAWGVNGQHLTSLNNPKEIWPPKRPAVARCDGVNDDGKKIHRKGCTPHWQCGCGIFAHVDADDVPTSHFMHRVIAVGVVALWGKVIECLMEEDVHYYIAEFAYPYRLMLIGEKVSRSQAENISKIYGIPAYTLPEDLYWSGSWYVKAAVKRFLLYGEKFVFHEWKMMIITDVQPKPDELPNPLRSGEAWKPTAACQSRK